MTIELVLRLAKEAGLCDEGLDKLKRDLELFEEGRNSTTHQYYVPPLNPITRTPDWDYRVTCNSVRDRFQQKLKL